MTPAVCARVRRRVEWADTDASGHYHYGTALRLFEAAESELLERLGLLDEIYGRLPRVHASFDYRSVLWFRDDIEATVCVADVGRTSISYSFEALRDGERCIEGKVVAVLVDERGRPQPWPERHLKLLAPPGAVRSGEPARD